MPNTWPEGITPPPQLLVATEPQRTVGSRSFLIVLSTILGIILTTGAVLGVVGKAFYVEREEYTQKNIQNTQDRVVFTEGLKSITSRLDRLDATIDRLAVVVQDLKIESARRNRR